MATTSACSMQLITPSGICCLENTPSSQQRFCFALYSPPSAANLKTQFEIEKQLDCSRKAKEEIEKKRKTK